MADDPNTQILVNRWSNGETDARDGLIAKLLPDLAQIAAARLRGERNSSLSTSDLINDAVVRLIRMGHVALTDRAHVIAISSRMMRNILVDCARAKRTDRRRHEKIELCTAVEGQQRFELYSLDSALIRLGALAPDLMEIVEMRYFGGMTITDIAQVTDLSEATVKRRWQTARAWLTDALLNPIDNG